MKNLSVTALGISALLIIIVSCKKDQGVIPDFLKATDFWKDIGPNHQKFSLNAASGGTITGSKGTSILFPPGAFVDANGTIVIEFISLELTEMLSRKDIFLSGVLTEADGQLLVSGGEFLIEAKKQNGDALRLNPQLGAAGQGPRMEVPAVQGADPGMKLFVRRERQPQG